MREIKFRGKRVDDDAWVYGNLIIEPKMMTGKSIYTDIRNVGKSDYCIYPFEPSDGRGREVHPESVGQFIGLKDKDGNEIYEVDIIGLKTMQGVPWNCVISYGSEDAAAFAYREKKPWGNYSVILRKEFTDTIEIIGNIHENPELLGDKE